MAFPLPPNLNTTSLLMHPRDLLADGRDFYTQIQFVPYDSSMINKLGNPFGSGYGSANPFGGIALPIPKKLNDTQFISWQEVSLTAMAAEAATRALVDRARGMAAKAATRALVDRARGVVATMQQEQLAKGALGALSVLSGYQINPALWMMFQSPTFKEFTLTWTFAPNNAQESNDIADIVNHIKHRSLPGTTLGGLLYEYPHIALIRLYPNNFFTFRFKPCAVLSVDVDYTGAGIPSFFKNGAPTIVNLTIHLKEIELWTKNNYYL